MIYALPKLNKQLGQILRLPLTILLAPMGFGKTTAMQEYLEGCGFAYAQLQLMERQTDNDMIWECFTRALKRDLPALAQAFIRVAAPGDSAERAQLINAIEDSITSQTILVFDNYQNVVSPAIHKFIEILSRRNIPALHIVLISRTRPPIACIEELRLKGLCQIIEKQFFHFNEDDIAAYFKSNGVLLTKEGALSLRAYSDGWVAVLHFVLLEMLSEGKMDCSLILNDLLSQVLRESCNEKELSILYKLSQYQEFNASQADEYAKAADIETLLLRLSNDSALLNYERQRGLFTWSGLTRSYLQGWPQPSLPLRRTRIYNEGSAHPAENLKAGDEAKHGIQLCRREKQVLTLLCRGMRRADIAEALTISLSSVKKNIESLYVKLHVNNMAAAVSVARENGLVPLYLIQTQDQHTRKGLLSQQ